VLVIEYGRYVQEPAASWANAGGIRRQDQDPAEALLASMACARWPRLAAELEADLHYRQSGHLLLAADPQAAASLPAFVAAQHAMGFDDIQLLDHQQVHDLVPGLSEAILAGSFSPADGQADPIHTTRALTHAAQRLGACYWYETCCDHLMIAQDRIIGVQTNQGLVVAEHVVLATGAWSRPLAASVGLDLPIRARVLQVLCSTPVPASGRLPVLGVIGRALSLKQRSDGCFLLGGGWLGDLSSDGWHYQLHEARQQANWAVGAICIGHCARPNSPRHGAVFRRTSSMIAH
jgi:sarcosine oxidase subunit beta